MAKNTWKSRLISFADSKIDDQQYLKTQRQAYNSISIQMAELEKYQVQEDFTHCTSCQMVLTNLDREFIDDWNWVSSNQKNYSDMEPQLLQKMKQDKWNYYVWNCRFCSHKNLLQKNNIHFAKNKSKVIIRDAVKQKTNQSSLLLFLIDISSSMEQQIPQFHDQSKVKKSNNLKETLSDILKKTTIYQKISEAQKNSLNQIKKKVDDAKSETYVDFLSKYKLFMCMTEKIVAQICQDKNNINNNHTNAGNINQSKKIGFIFFNSDVILQKMMSKDGKKVIKVSDKSDSDYSKDGLKVDFDNFNQLYHLGKNNSENYGADINNFKFSDIQIGNMNPSGQTALGPALAIGLGIVSNYAPGSIIIIVTDGKANKGVFGEEGIYQQQMKVLRLRIEKSKTQVCVLKIENKNTEQEGKKNVQQQSSLQKYLRKSGCNFSICLQNKLQAQIRKKLSIIYDRAIKSVGFTNQIKIKCQCPFVSVNESKLNQFKRKLFSRLQRQYIVLNITEQNKLTPFDYRHPFMTQILINCQNTITKQQCKYVTYLMQKIVKYKDMDHKDQKSFNSMQTLRNVLDYLEAEGQKLNMANIPLSMCQQSFRTAVMESYRHSQRRQMKKQMVLELANEMDKTPLVYKTPKDYINSLIQKPYNCEENNQEVQIL